MPPPGSYVQPYPTPTGPAPQVKDRTVDLALSWILFVLQVLGSVAMWIISIFAYVVDSLCEGGSEACADGGAGSAVSGYWIALAILVVATLIGMIVATSTKRPAWPWAVGGFGLTVVATIVFFAILAN